MRNKKMPSSRSELEDFVKKKGLHPYGVVSYKGRDIFLAETELMTDDPTMAWGYYQAAWFVTAPFSMEKMDGGSWGIYEAMHDLDKGWSQEEKRQARLRDMVAKAQEWIDRSEEKGRYEIQ